VPSGVINLCTHQLMNKPSYLMIADRTTSTGSEWRRQAFVETEAVIEQAAQGWKRRPQRAGDRGSMTDGGLIAKDTCRHVIGSV
jgi:hypothetical protein